MEEWKPIKELNGAYEASTLGNIRNAKTKKIKSIAFDGHYWKFGFDYVFKGKRNRGWYRVHKAVAETFIPNPDNKPTVNHIDGDHGNNTIENLEWATHSEQIRHMQKVLRLGCCEKHFNAKLTNDDVRKMRKMYEEGINVTQLSKIFGVTHGNISSIVHYKKWKYV